MARAGEMRLEFWPERFAPPTARADPDAMDEMMRWAIVDRRPDAPLFEDEYPRNSDEYESIITLFHAGRRSAIDPDMPDLMLGETERDPRGQSTVPDYYALEDHMKPRYQYYLKRATDDGGVNGISGVIEPQELWNKIRGSRDQLKDIYKIFESSYENFIPGDSRRSITRLTMDSQQLCTDPYTCSFGKTPNSYEMTPDPNIVFSNTFETKHQLQTDHKLPEAYGDMVNKSMRDVADQTVKHLGEFSHQPDKLLDAVVYASKMPVANPYDEYETRRAIEFEGTSVAPEGTSKELMSIVARMGFTPADAYTLLRLMELTENDIRFKESVTPYTKLAARPNKDQTLKYISELTCKESANVQLEMKKNLREIIRSMPGPSSASAKRLLMNETIMGVTPKFVEYMTQLSKGKVPDPPDRAVALTDVRLGEQRSTGNKKGQLPTTSRGGRDTASTVRLNESRKTFNYGRVLPAEYKQRGFNGAPTADMHNSTQTAQVNGGVLPSRRDRHTTGVAEHNGDKTDFGYLNRLSKAQGHRRLNDVQLEMQNFMADTPANVRPNTIRPTTRQ